MDAQQEDAAACAASASTPPIFTLPDEILLTIASSLAKNSHLCQLSRVSKRWRHVAQEALVKSAILPLNGVGKFTRMLYDYRRDLALKIKHVDLGDYQYEETHPDKTNPGPGKIFDPDLIHKCRALVDSINGEGYWTNILEDAEKNQDGIWTTDRQFFFNILVALSPNLKYITLQLPKMPDPWLVEDYKLYPPFPELASKLLQTRLRVLTIPKSNTWKSLRAYNLNLRALSSLVRLSLPMDAFIYPNEEPTQLVQVLPPNLEWLQLRPCNKHIRQWITELRHARMAAEFPHLCQLDLFFSSCIRSSLLLINQGRGVPNAFSSDVRLLVQAGVNIRCSDGSEKPSVDLLKEVDAWSHLSDLEAWFTAAKGKQFSETVSRSENGTPRWRTKLEARSFLRGNKAPVKLRRVSRFTPQVSLDGVPQVTFGKKKDDAELGPKYAPTAQVWTNMHSSCTVMTQNTTLNTVPSIEKAMSPRQRDRSSSYIIAASERSSTPPALTASAATFDVKEWSGVEFFTDVEATPTSRPRLQKRSRKTMACGASKSRSPTPRPRRLKQKVV